MLFNFSVLFFFVLEKKSMVESFIEVSQELGRWYFKLILNVSEITISWNVEIPYELIAALPLPFDEISSIQQIIFIDAEVTNAKAKVNK